MDWTQVKTGKMKVVYFTSHANSYVTCAFNSLLSHFVVNGNAQTRGDYVFPALCDQDQPNHKMTKLWKDFYDDDENEFKKYTPAGITAAVRQFGVRTYFYWNLCAGRPHWSCEFGLGR